MKPFSPRLIQIEKYIQAYNSKDVEGMLTTLHPEVHFVNMSRDQVTLELHNKEAFRQQAEAALSYFEEREQTVTHVKLSPNEVEITIRYRAVLAKDFPNGMKAGEAVEMTGKSIFTFREGLIAKIEDIS